MAEDPFLGMVFFDQVTECLLGRGLSKDSSPTVAFCLRNVAVRGYLATGLEKVVNLGVRFANVLPYALEICLSVSNDLDVGVVEEVVEHVHWSSLDVVEDEDGMEVDTSVKVQFLGDLEPRRFMVGEEPVGKVCSGESDIGYLRISEEEPFGAEGMGHIRRQLHFKIL